MDELVTRALCNEMSALQEALGLAETLRRGGTPAPTALRQAEARVRARELPPYLTAEARSAVLAERDRVLGMLRDALDDPRRTCPGQDPIDWLLLAVESRARELARG